MLGSCGLLPNFSLRGYMAKEFSKAFYNSKKWKDCRNAFINMKFGICERCGQPNSKQVHHKIYLSPDNINNPDVSLNFNNLELLCDTCHQNEHYKKYSAVQIGYKFNEYGELVKIK